jgi:diguanylate cyclase (GGDEF)-like protein/PAS domain S-box-containing protein
MNIIGQRNTYVVICFDEQGTVLSCNQVFFNFFAAERLQENSPADDFYAFMPRFQPDGRISQTFFNNHIVDAFEQKLNDRLPEFPWLFKRADGLHFHAGVTLSKHNELDKDFVMCRIMASFADQAQAFNEFREREKQRFSIVLDTAPVKCTFWDEERKPVICNQSAADLFGLSNPQEFLDRFNELSPPLQPCGAKSDEKMLHFLDEAFEEGYCKFEWTYQKPDGTPIPMAVDLARVHWDDGYGLIGFAVDLREENAFDEDYYREESAFDGDYYKEKFQLIVDNMPLAFICRDESLDEAVSSRVARDLLGVSAENEYSGRILDFSPLLQPCGTPSKMKAEEYIALAHEKGTVTFDWISQKADGTAIPTEITLISVKWRGNTMLCAFLRDMGDIIKTESAQKAARTRIVAMINASPMMCYVCDTNFDVIDCNDVSPKLMGVGSKQEFLDNFRKFHPRRQPCGRTSVDAAEDYLGRAFDEGSNTFTWWFRKPNKEPLPVESSVSRVELDGEQLLIVYSRDLRESIKYEQEQIAANERVLAMVNASPMMCFICDVDLNVLDCNDRAPSLLQLESKQAFIDNFMELHPRTQPDGRHSRDAAKSYLGEAFKGTTSTFEWHFQRADGEILPAEISPTLTQMDGRSVLIVYCRDLRDHYRYMEEQRVLRDRMETIINASPMVCFVLNRELEVVDCNLSGEKFFGVSSYQELTIRFGQLHPTHQPDGSVSATKILELFNNAFETGSQTFKWTHLSTSGEELPVEVHVRKVFVDSKDYCIVYLRDLRESIKFSQERRVARERIVAMLDASPMACSILDNEFNILICNESVVELFGLKNKGDYISNFLQLHPENQPDGRNSLEKLSENITRAFVGGASVITFEWMFQTLTGDLVPSEITLKPVTLDDQNLMIAYIQDLRHIKQAAQAVEALEKLAYTDSLTGASNRRYFMDAAERELKSSIANGHPFALIMLDIDDFKSINDSFGHVVGDGVLKILVSRMRHTLRKNVVVARYGGEEFVVMMPGISEEAAERTAWRIRKNIEGSKFLVEGVKVRVTVSMGIAGRADEKDSLNDIIVRADKALYEAKTRGKNTIVQFDETMEAKFSDVDDNQ